MSESESQSSSPAEVNVAGLLDLLRPAIKSATRASIRDVGIFGCALRAALAKSFEFTAFVHTEPAPEHGFFVTSTLRGVCEDLIVLSFIHKLAPETRNEALGLLMAKAVADGISAQSVFFEFARPWQPVLKPPKDGQTDTDNKLKTIAASLGWTGKKAWPSTWFMAKASGLAPIYSFVYATTSKWVHFSPHVLLRMGWGGSKDDSSDETKWDFTTQNFVPYYVDFNRVYALMLLLRMLRGPSNPLLPSDVLPTIEALERQLEKPLRWPEDVTFEEMNINGPGTIARILLRAAHEKGTAEPT
jgi:hypothetical protein